MTDTDEQEQELPAITKIETDTNDHGGGRAKAYFANGAALQYERLPTRDGREADRNTRIVEKTFAASDPESAWDLATVVGGDNAAETTPTECLVESLEVYSDFETLADLKHAWEPLYNAFTAGGGQ